jgi:hypothetical protein
MEIDLTDCEWQDVDGVQVPICGTPKEMRRIIKERLLGPQGQPLDQWEKTWRADHTPHYLQALKMDNRMVKHCMVVGARLNGANLEGWDLSGVNLTNASLRGANLSGANLENAVLVKTDFSRANLHRADLSFADLSGSDMSMAYCKGANFHGAKMWRVHLRHAICDSAIFFGTDLTLANGMYASFWGARFDDAKMDRMQHLDTANFVRWLNPDSSKQEWSMKPVEGWHRVVSNPMGTTTFQVNAGRQ